jgi:hypothetical protein
VSPQTDAEILRQLDELRADIREEHEERREFRKQLNTRLDRNDERGDRIETQVRATNGRVLRLETWQAEIRGGVKVARVAAGPISRYAGPAVLVIVGIAIGRGELISQALEALGLLAH